MRIWNELQLHLYLIIQLLITLKSIIILIMDLLLLQEDNIIHQQFPSLANKWKRQQQRRQQHQFSIQWCQQIFHSTILKSYRISLTMTMVIRIYSNKMKSWKPKSRILTSKINCLRNSWMIMTFWLSCKERKLLNKGEKLKAVS